MEHGRSLFAVRRRNASIPSSRILRLFLTHSSRFVHRMTHCPCGHIAPSNQCSLKEMQFMGHLAALINIKRLVAAEFRPCKECRRNLGAYVLLNNKLTEYT
jgi:hypothetical protein